MLGVWFSCNESSSSWPQEKTLMLVTMWAASIKLCDHTCPLNFHFHASFDDLAGMLEKWNFKQFFPHQVLIPSSNLSWLWKSETSSSIFPHQVLIQLSSNLSWLSHARRRSGTLLYVMKFLGDNSREVYETFMWTSIMLSKSEFCLLRVYYLLQVLGAAPQLL